MNPTNPTTPAARVGTGRAHAKVILLGDHAVVYGVPALAIAFPQLTVTATVEPAPEASETTCSPEIGGEALRGLQDLVARFRVDTGVADRDALRLAMDSRIPPGRGLGSSAACARAVVLALAQLYDRTLDAEEIFDLVQVAETAAHGKSSGIDALATAAPGLIRFAAGAAQDLHCGFDGVFVVADSGASGRTKDAIAQLRRTFDADPDTETRFLHRIRRLTEAGEHALAHGDPEAFGAQLTANHEVLREVGISTERIDTLVRAALDNGALGAKISGGGLGGCLIALAADPDRAQPVAAALRASGAVDTWFIPVGRFSDAAR